MRSNFTFISRRAFHHVGRFLAARHHGLCPVNLPLAACKQEARRLGRKKGRAVASKRRNSKRKEIKERLVKELGVEEFRKIVQSDIQKREGACRPRYANGEQPCTAARSIHTFRCEQPCTAARSFHTFRCERGQGSPALCYYILR